MSPTGDEGLGALIRGLADALSSRDAEAFAALWPDVAGDYARAFFGRLLKSVPAGPRSGSVAPLARWKDCGILRPSWLGTGSADIGYCRINGRLKLVWKYAAARRNLTAGWAAERTRHYLVRFSPELGSATDLAAFDTVTERIAEYFSLKVPGEPGEFVLLSRKDEFSGSVPPLLNKCDYVDPVTADIVSTVAADRHEITHRVFLLNGFPCRALPLLQEGVAEIFNPVPYLPESSVALTPASVRDMLDEGRFYSDVKNFSRAARFCNGVMRLLGMDVFRKLYRASAAELFPMLESFSGCGLEEFLARVMERTKLPPVA